MFIFEKQKQFNRFSGQEIAPVWMASGSVICDYCGQIIDVDDIDNLSDTKLTVVAKHNVEAWYGSRSGLCWT